MEPDNWTKIKHYCVENNYDYLSYNSNDLINIDTKIITKQGVGCFFKINNNKYVISCYHVIGFKNIETIGYAINKKNKLVKFKLTPVKNIPELDLTILKINTENSFKYFEESDCIKICDLNSNIIFLNLNMLNIETNNLKNDLIKLDNFAIVNTHFVSLIIPKIPMFEFDYNNCIDIEKSKGFSGSVLYQDKNIVGILTSYCLISNKFQALPIILLYKLLKQYDDGLWKEFYGFNISTKLVNIIFSNEIVRHNAKYIIDDTINFKRIKYEDDMVKLYKNDLSLKKNEFILEVNNKKINDNGTIYYDIFGCNIFFDTFLMFELFFNENNSCNFKIVKQDEKKYNLNLVGKTFDKLYNVHIFNNHQYIYWKGFTFCELSEELLNNIKTITNKNINGNIATQLKLSEKKNIGKKYVIIIDININKIFETTCDIINLLPFVEDENNNLSLCYLEKIGNKKINCQNDLKNILDIKNNIKMSLFYQTKTENISFVIKS